MIKIVYVEDTGRRTYIGDKKVFDRWCPPTFEELVKIFHVHGINDDLESLYQFIVNGGIYRGSLEVTASFEGGCVLDLGAIRNMYKDC